MHFGKLWKARLQLHPKAFPPPAPIEPLCQDSLSQWGERNLKAFSLISEAYNKDYNNNIFLFFSSLFDERSYWAVTDIDYAHQRTAKRIGIMIVILWILSFLVSIAPMLGWKDPEWDKRLENYECLVSQDIGYQIFATASSFYVPLLAILFLYWRIFLVARKRIRKRQQVNRDQIALLAFLPPAPYLFCSVHNSPLGPHSSHTAPVPLLVTARMFCCCAFSSASPSRLSFILIKIYRLEFCFCVTIAEKR